MEPSKPKLSQTTLGLQQPSKQRKRDSGDASKGSSRSGLISLWLSEDMSTCVGGTKVVRRWYEGGTKVVRRWYEGGTKVVRR